MPTFVRISIKKARFWFKTPEFCVYWDVPEDYRLEKTHSLLHLVAEILLPHERTLRELRHQLVPEAIVQALLFSRNRFHSRSPLDAKNTILVIIAAVSTHSLTIEMLRHLSPG